MKGTIAYLFLIFLSSFIIAQDLNNDAAVWASVEVEKKITKAFDISLKHQSRFNNNVNNYGLAYLDLGGTYKLHKMLRFNAGVRYGRTNLFTGDEFNRWRVYACVLLKYSIRQFNFTYRNQTQYQLVPNNEEVGEWYNRNRLSVGFELNKRIEPSISAEIYTPLNHPEGIHPDRLRFITGVTVKLTKQLSAEPYFLFQHKYHYYAPIERDYVYGINVTYGF